MTVSAHRKCKPAGAPLRDGFVYVAEAANGRVKIGWTTEPAKRIAHLERALHEDVYVWACVPGTRQDEQRAHELWAGVALGNEWFSVTDELLAWAEVLAASVRFSDTPPAGRAPK